MSLGGLGTRADRRANVSGFPFGGLLSIIFLLVGVGGLGRELVLYSSRDLGNLQADVRVAGLQVGGLSESQAQRIWEAVYLDQPLTLIYKDSPIVYTPRELGFRTNNEAMLALVRAQSNNEDNFWKGFWAYLWNQSASPVQVPLDGAVQEGQLRTILEDIAARYDSQAGAVGFNPATLQFESGSAGSSLDIEAAIGLISQALLNPDPAQRVAELPTRRVSGGGASTNDLREAIFSYWDSKGFLYDGVTTIASLFVMDLGTGEEMSILGDVAHSGVSTIKVALMINYFRYQVQPPDADTAYLLSSAMICSHNPGANYIVQVTSNTRQSIEEGLLKASQTMVDMGAGNSWLTSPLWVGADGYYPVIKRPASPLVANPNYNAQPDVLNQSTAEDMGTMLSLIYDCAKSGGGLAAVFPEEITQDECVMMEQVLSGVKFFRFSELGVPEGVRVAHKVGYGTETVSDVAIVFSPATDYVFTVYIWEEDLDNDFLTELDKWEMIDELATIVYNYFNSDAQMSGPQPPANLLGGAACVLPKTTEEINLFNIDDNRFDPNGNPLPSACYDWPNCRVFDNWGGTR